MWAAICFWGLPWTADQPVLRCFRRGIISDAGKTPRRPKRRYAGLFKYYGGKARLSGWIVEHLPDHDCYVEPFCGGARVLYAKPRARIEVLNDLDKGVTSALQACRDHPDELADLLALTPYSRPEYEEAVRAASEDYRADLVEAARLFLVLVEQGRNGQSNPQRSAWRIQRPAARTGRSEAGWTRLPHVVLEATARLQGVTIECRDAAKVIEFYDAPRTLFYVDPPYHPRSCDVSGYAHRLTVEHHARLAERLGAVRGMVVLSGYRHPDYDQWYADWTRLDRAHSCGAAAGEGGDFRRVESLWFNTAAWEAYQRGRQTA